MVRLQCNERSFKDSEIPSSTLYQPVVEAGQASVHGKQRDVKITAPSLPITLDYYKISSAMRLSYNINEVEIIVDYNGNTTNGCVQNLHWTKNNQGWPWCVQILGWNKDN